MYSFDLKQNKVKIQYDICIHNNLMNSTSVTFDIREDRHWLGKVNFCSMFLQFSVLLRHRVRKATNRHVFLRNVALSSTMKVSWHSAIILTNATTDDLAPKRLFASLNSF